MPAPPGRWLERIIVIWLEHRDQIPSSVECCELPLRQRHPSHFAWAEAIDLLVQWPNEPAGMSRSDLISKVLTVAEFSDAEPSERSKGKRPP